MRTGAAKLPITMANPETEYLAAREILNRSVEVTRWFARSIGGLNARGRFSVTILDEKYWFAKLYQLMTYYEIGAVNKFAHGRFVMHFIHHFYMSYYTPLRQYVEGNGTSVPTHWRAHFAGRPRASRDSSSVSDWVTGLQTSIVTGVTAHIKGDMAPALESAYRSWVPSNGSKPEFSALKADLTGQQGLAVFDLAKAAFFLDVAHYSPFPWRVELQQYIFGVGEQLGAGGLDINEVFKWREEAWKTAAANLLRPAASTTP